MYHILFWAIIIESKGSIRYEICITIYTGSRGNAESSGRAGRSAEECEKALQALANGYPQKSVIYYGLRGVGKTVLLNAIEEQAENFDVLYAHIEITEKRSFIVQIANMSKKSSTK